MGVCVSGPVMEGRLVQGGFLPDALSCPGEALATCKPLSGVTALEKNDLNCFY